MPVEPHPPIAPLTRSARHHPEHKPEQEPERHDSRAAALGSFASDPDLRAERAHCAMMAACSVRKLFLHRLLGIPGTLIGEASAPASKRLTDKLTRWNYWWQAQLLDVFIDAAEREQTSGHDLEARHWLERGEQLLRGIRWHNFGTYRNRYYDDMAWLTLAACRLNDLSRSLTGRGSLPAQEVGQALYPQLDLAQSDELGGGCFWNKDENFKNTPANGPIALAWARAGRHETARELLSWLRAHLWDEQRGYLDGITLLPQDDGPRKPQIDDAEFSYNQGSVLGALLSTDGADLAHAEQIIAVIQERFTQQVELEGRTFTVLRTHGTGDAGLFTGILARYLALAAEDHRLAPPSRATARELILSTADLLWDGHRAFDPELPLNEPGVDVREIRGQAVAVFSTDPGLPASKTLGAGARIELSGQVQAWTILEAAYRLS